MTHTVIFEWDAPNANFLPLLAQASPAVHLPSRALSEAVSRSTLPTRSAGGRDARRAGEKLGRAAQQARQHVQVRQSATADVAAVDQRQRQRPRAQLFVRNPYYHRIDARGVQLPYIDVVDDDDRGRRSDRGQVQCRGSRSAGAGAVDFRDVAILKKGEADGGNYRTFLWANGVASQIAIYPNLNFRDPVWREVMRDVRFRRALSMGIDRRMINRALYFGLASEGGMTALSSSPLYNEDDLMMWSEMDIQAANALLDEMGLTERTPAGLRKLPDGRPMEFVIETAGERQEVENALAIVTDTWRELGIKLVMRPLDRDILRNRVYAGITMAAVWYGWDNGLPTRRHFAAVPGPDQSGILRLADVGAVLRRPEAARESHLTCNAAKRLMDLAERVDPHHRQRPNATRIWQRDAGYPRRAAVRHRHSVRGTAACRGVERPAQCPRERHLGL